MRKLEDIPKKEIFTVPDGYFDKLPLNIQARTAKIKKSSNPVIEYTFKYALPAVVILIAIVIWFGSNTKTISPNAELLLTTVETEELVAYLHDSDLTTDEVLESIEFGCEDLNEIEESVYEIVID